MSYWLKANTETRTASPITRACAAPETKLQSILGCTRVPSEAGVRKSRLTSILKKLHHKRTAWLNPCNHCCLVSISFLAHNPYSPSGAGRFKSFPVPLWVSQTELFQWLYTHRGRPVTGRSTLGKAAQLDTNYSLFTSSRLSQLIHLPHGDPSGNPSESSILRPQY